MGKAWDDAVDRSFAKRVRKMVRRVANECETDDPYTVADEIGRELLDDIDSTYGLDQESAEAR